MFGSSEPSEGCFLGRQRRCVRLGRGNFSLFWKLHSISLGKSTVYLYKCPALGLRDYHIDVSGSEETDAGKDEKAVGSDGHLERGQEEEDPSDSALGAFVTHRDFLHGQIYSTPRGKK